MILAREYWLILVDVPNHPTNLEEEMEWIQVDRSDVESIIELDQDSLDIGETRMKRLDTREDMPVRMIPMETEDRDERDIHEQGEIGPPPSHSIHPILSLLLSRLWKHRVQYNPVSLCDSYLLLHLYIRFNKVIDQL